ncbi:pentatricopeptide repeat-containing protein At2g13420, mitochondrial-like [Magnolia sinica]|uniref:pentatricopeptide repeat-containing protein At2g13420, mitochondrial-like n=1 Tax=Magnolia sinica TaxID=86752 RepID=UPI002658B61E|nr:pentatricopeptide repeat-containing protein At2g13420, mitochondrial-like [Magnolia sinica]
MSLRLSRLAPLPFSFSLNFSPFSKLRLFSHLSEAHLELGFSEALKPSKDADHLSQILIQHHNPFHTIESSLQLSGIRVSSHLVLQTLLRLRNLSKIALGFFTWAHHQPNYHHDVAAYDLMIDILSKVRQFDVAWQLFVEMSQRGQNPTPNTFAVLIRRYIAAGMTRQAIRTFDDMGSFCDRKTDLGHFNFLLDTLCKYGYVKIATEIFNKRRSEFIPDVKTYTVLIYGWCKINRFPMAEKFFREMIDRGLEPNIVTYNVLLNGLCRKSSLHPETRFERTIQAAENLFEEMQRRGVEPDVTSYSIVLHVYSRAHKPDLSLWKLGLMKESGISPTVATYTSVIKCLCSCGRLEDAEKLLDEMVGNDVCPSAATYNCFFKEYRGRKDADSALKLYRKVRKLLMSEPSILSINSYNILVGMFSKLDRMEIVRELWNDMKESGVGPDLDSYTLLIHRLCEKQKWREACQFFVEMIEKGFLPQKTTFETLYKGLIQSDMLRTWRRLKNKLEEESLKFGVDFQQYHFKPYRR